MITMNYNSLDKNHHNKKDMNPMRSPKNFTSVPHTVRSIIHEALVYRRGGWGWGWGSDGLGVCDCQMQTITYRMENKPPI